jgi:hypothetical protein
VKFKRFELMALPISEYHGILLKVSQFSARFVVNEICGRYKMDLFVRFGIAG